MTVVKLKQDDTSKYLTFSIYNLTYLLNLLNMYPEPSKMSPEPSKHVS